MPNRRREKNERWRKCPIFRQSHPVVNAEKLAAFLAHENHDPIGDSVGNVNRLLTHLLDDHVKPNPAFSSHDVSKPCPFLRHTRPEIRQPLCCWHYYYILSLREYIYTNFGDWVIQGCWYLISVWGLIFCSSTCCEYAPSLTSYEISMPAHLIT